jgi:hypothetical protein
MNGITAEMAALLRQTAKPAEAKAKSGSELPRVKATPVVEAACQRLASLIKLKKDQEAEEKSLKSVVYGAGQAAVYEISRASGKVQKSVNIAGLTYSMKDKTSEKIILDKEGIVRSKLEGIFGARFPEFFVEEYTMNVDFSKLTPELLAGLRQVGITPDVMLHPTEALFAARILNADIQEKLDNLGIKGQDQASREKE